jgi:hypothetical protein
MTSYELRPGERVVRSKKNALIRPPFSDWIQSTQRYALEGGRDYVLPSSEAARICRDHHDVEIVEQVSRGEMPRVIDGTTREAFEFLHGHPPTTPRSDLLADLEIYHGLSRSPGEAVLKLIDHGWNEDDAIRYIQELVERAVEQRVAYGEPWHEAVRVIVEGPDPSPEPEEPEWAKDLI